MIYILAHNIQVSKARSYILQIGLILCLFVLFIPNLLAFQASPSNHLYYQQSKQGQASVLNKIVPLGNEYQNSIKLLNNRFRIDSDVQAVTLVFFREYGSAPIVLVRPDGSKLFLENDNTDDSYQWFETDTYDMISLHNPMPGPWQAVGKILPHSRVMVIADITLNAKPIPSPIYSGETLKQTATLENGGTEINMNSFKDVVSLSIDFVSTNNPSYANFGLGSRSIAIFEDNGMGLDEREGDGKFTGQFNLKIVEGEWQPVFTIRTPLFSREQVDEPVVLLPNPVLVSHQFTEVPSSLDQDGQEVLNNEITLEIDVEREELNISSVIVDGSIRHPNGENESFYITQSSPSSKKFKIKQRRYGIHQVNLTVFAKTVEGRDVVISAEEYSVLIEAPVLELPNESKSLSDTSKADIQSLAKDTEESESLEKEDTPFSMVYLAIFINIIILIIGSIVIFFIIDKRRHPDNFILKRLKFKLPKISFKKNNDQNTEATAS